MQRLGQHFLTNRSVLQRIASEAAKASPQTIIEIGPGHGELTEMILDRVSRIANRKNAPHVLAVEKDPELVKVLREKYTLNPNIRIIEGDIRAFLPRFAIRDTRYAIVGNIPYYLTGYLFRLIGELEQKPELCVFMIQKEVAERLVAKPPFMNRLAAAVQYRAEAKILLTVGKDDFSPPPKVDSALIRLTYKPTGSKKSEDRYFSLIRHLFTAPRKTILNNLAGKIAAGPRAKFEKEIRRRRIDPSQRPQNLKIEEIQTLAEYLVDEL